MIAFPVPTTLTKRVKNGTDSFGNDVWSTTSIEVDAQAFDPGTSMELVQGQDVVTTQPTLYYPPGTSVENIDAIQVAGKTYEVDGDPADALMSPFTGWAPGVVVKLRRVTG